ncbi:MAG: glycosyltransferase [Acidilobaceae archaeon]|nr:glycosyltransferase [Acidilobaceae archaeon]
MTKVLVQHTFWAHGGAERVFFVTVKSLANAGFDVTVYTDRKSNVKIYEDVMGEPWPRSVIIKEGKLASIGTFTVYKSLLTKLVDNIGTRYDAVVVTQGPFYPWEAPRTQLLLYLHFPPLDIEIPALYPLPQSPLRRLAKLLYKMYLALPVYAQKLAHMNMVKRAFKIFANSRFTLAALSLYVRGLEDIMSKATILNPPLIGAERLLSHRKAAKEPCIATISRFSEEKKLELVLEAARRLKGYRFYIAGGVASRASRLYYERIARSRPPNVTLAANVPESTKEALLGKCQVYLHTMVGEHFGIAPLEALAAGATPVVHKFSGTWTDVCAEKYCYGFSSTDPEEVAERVQEALEKPILAPPDHFEKFSPELFGKRMVKAVEEAVLR